MGTDIHAIVQAKVDDRWVDVASEWEQDRHYALFAWLGDVRNGHGLGGVRTHSPVAPLSEGRGFPSDFDLDDDGPDLYPVGDFRNYREGNYREGNYAWLGDHSFSWVSGEEVLSTPPPKLHRTGIISIETFNEWDGVSSPPEWCGGITGPKVVVSSPFDLSDETTHVEVEWESEGEFDYFVSEVQRLVDLHGEIRVVFGFDS